MIEFVNLIYVFEDFGFINIDILLVDFGVFDLLNVKDVLIRNFYIIDRMILDVVIIVGLDIVEFYIGMEDLLIDI